MTESNENFTNLEPYDKVDEIVEQPKEGSERRYASSEALDNVRASLVELQKEIKQLRQWLAGGVDHNGRPVPGVLQTIDQIRSARKWILGLLGAIAVSSITNSVMNLLHQVKLP